MPMTTFERDKPSSTGSGDGLAACCTPLGKQLTEAVSAVGLVLSRRKFLSGQYSLAVCTNKTLSMPCLILKSNPSCGHNFFALRAFGSKFFFETTNAVNVSLVGNYERLGSHLGFAHHALKAFVMPLSRLVLHFLHTWSKSVATGIAPTSKFSVIASCTKNEGVLSCKRFLHQTRLALPAFETVLMPMKVLI